MSTLIKPCFSQSSNERDLIEFSQNLLNTEPGTIHEDNTVAALRGIAGRIRRERELQCVNGKA